MRAGVFALKFGLGETDTGGMHLILYLAKRLGIGQQRVGGAGLFIAIVIGIPAVIIVWAKYFA